MLFDLSSWNLTSMASEVVWNFRIFVTIWPQCSVVTSLALPNFLCLLFMSQIFALKHVCVHESLSQFFEVAHLHVRYLLLKKKNLHFHDVFGWLSLTCSTIENGMSRKSSTRIIWKCEMTLNSTFVTFPTCKTTFVLHNSLMYEWSENWHKMQLHIVLKPGQKLKDFLEVLSIIFS